MQTRNLVGYQIPIQVCIIKVEKKGIWIFKSAPQMKIGIFALNSDVWKMHQKLLCRWGYKKLRYYTMFLKNFVYSKLTFAQISRKKIAVLY